ncbi:unnamed protein product [Blepharisma stoltei]|uniref:Uncharacterized protein n=1 Tax=Blepharisma stoltei TaxID=1481888 RepID=A0AAU9JYY7_9CILI|nr:unnamed protein product [Blepharisma stoltei]
MSINLNNTYHSLEEVKKQRKGLEKNAIKINCRIKLLQQEEQKAMRAIKTAKSKQKQIIASRRYNDQLSKTKMQWENWKQQEMMRNKEWIRSFRNEREKNKLQNEKAILDARKEAYKKGREIRDLSLKRKNEIKLEIIAINKERSQSVKLNEKKIQETLETWGTVKVQVGKDDYLKRVEKEAAKKKEVEMKILEMEMLESEIIAKLEMTKEMQKITADELQWVTENKEL